MRLAHALAATTLALTLAACGGSEDGAETDAADETRSVEHALGTTEVPADPSTSEPVHTEVVNRVPACAARTHSSTR